MDKNTILNLLREQEVRFLRLQVTDIFGQLKNVALTVSQARKALDNQIMIDGSSIEGFVRIHESDQYLWPDLSSFSMLPWNRGLGNVARLICDVHNPDGSPFVGDPRYVLKRQLQAAADMGFTFNVGPECEFFLFKHDENGQVTLEPNDRAAYFDLGPLDNGEMTRSQICLSLEEMGFEIEASHHECGPGQHEIDFKYADALTAADNIMTFRLAVKTIAGQYGFHATFMPKPLFGEAGSGMHTNMSLFRDGKNAFYDEGGERRLSRLAYHFIAGLLEHVPGMCLVTNPLVNSYKRLVPGFEAPCYLAWSAQNRSALVRVPVARGQSTRVELRSPDPSCNPYLALALCLAAGLDGIRRELEPPAEVAENIYHLSPAQREHLGIRSLPGSLKEAITAFKADPLIRETLGEHVYQQYLTGKEAEWEEYRTRVSTWEIDKYINHY